MALAFSAWARSVSSPPQLLRRRFALGGYGYGPRSRLEHGPAVATGDGSDAEDTPPGPAEVLTRRATPGPPASWPHSFDHCFEVVEDENRHLLRSAGTPDSAHVGVFPERRRPEPSDGPLHEALGPRRSTRGETRSASAMTTRSQRLWARSMRGSMVLDIGWPSAVTRPANWRSRRVGVGLPSPRTRQRSRRPAGSRCAAGRCSGGRRTWHPG